MAYFGTFNQINWHIYLEQRGQDSNRWFWNLADTGWEVAKHSVEAALAAGYRHIDTAAAYGNEESVGAGIKASGVARDQIFLTTKLWNADHGYDATKAAIDRSLQKLGVDYVDLYLIHWPNPVKFRDNWEEANAGSWKAMEEAYKDGKLRAIGVSNFRAKHLDALLKTANVKPMVNQIFLNPSDLQPEVVAYNAAHDILSEAYSPLVQARFSKLTHLRRLPHGITRVWLKSFFAGRCSMASYRCQNRYTMTASRKMPSSLTLSWVIMIWR